MAHWLVKSEPSAYSWSKLVSEGRTAWDGVRNFQARNNLAAMRNGDSVFFYHSVDDKQVVGVARVVREAYPDKTSDEDGWLAVDLEPAEALANPVSLEQIKADARLGDIALVRQGRLSVMPVSAEESRAIMSLSTRGGAKAGGASAKAKAGKTAKAKKATTAKPAKTVKTSTAKRAKAKSAKPAKKKTRR
jgi:predicted RNA-binding protein with PUA-like domain